MFRKDLWSYQEYTIVASYSSAVNRKAVAGKVLNSYQ